MNSYTNTLRKVQFINKIRTNQANLLSQYTCSPRDLKKSIMHSKTEYSTQCCSNCECSRCSELQGTAATIEESFSTAREPIT